MPLQPSPRTRFSLIEFGHKHLHTGASQPRITPVFSDVRQVALNPLSLNLRLWGAHQMGRVQVRLVEKP